jgi:S-DNA-T family DNA segregation ATPase FtsK/SpoIIIE
MGKQSSEAVSHQTLPGSVYVVEYLYLVFIFALLIVLTAISSFDPADVTIFNNTGGPGVAQTTYTNLFGPAGANLADWAFQLFGMGSLVFAGVFVVQLVGAFRRPRNRSRFLLRLFGYPQLILCYLGLLSAILPVWDFRSAGFFSGGVVGNALSVFLEQFLGRTGSILALSFGVCASLPLCLGVRPLSIISNFIGLFPSEKAKEIVKELRAKESPESGTHARNPSPPEPFRIESLQRSHALSPLSESPLGAKAASKIPVTPARVELGFLAKEEALSARFEPEQRAEHKVVSAADFQNLVRLLDDHASQNKDRDTEQELIKLHQESVLLEEKLATFGVNGKVVRSQPGPVVNVHEFEPAAGVKVTKVLALQDDLALGLKAQSVLMAPQPGKSTIGIEIPAHHRETVSLKELLESSVFGNNRAPLPMAFGKHVDGSPLIADLSVMPHLLVAGSTGSGKSVGINGILLSLMMNRTPSQLRLILVDPKMLELSVYDGIGHLLLPVVTDPSKAAGALKWSLDEMDRRYRLMKDAQVRNIASFNAAVESGQVPPKSDGKKQDTLPYIVIVIDELCDLMMTAPKDVEDSIQRLAQKARAAGIHLILATQRPSVDVITGVIKANLPCRISYQVASKHDSRTIIETVGAERLLGRGDMLFLPPGTSKLVRAQGAYVGDQEINAVAKRLKELYPAHFDEAMIDRVDEVSQDLCQKNDDRKGAKSCDPEADGNEMDENTMYDRAVEFAIASGTVSTSSVQRHFRIGYNRAARLIDRMAKEGLVGPSEVAGKPRQVIVPQR